LAKIWLLTKVILQITIMLSLLIHFQKQTLVLFLVLDANIMAKIFLKKINAVESDDFCGSRPSNCKKYKLGNTHAI
jgi:hypothetical protein